MHKKVCVFFMFSSLFLKKINFDIYFICISSLDPFFNGSYSTHDPSLIKKANEIFCGPFLNFSSVPNKACPLLEASLPAQGFEPIRPVLVVIAGFWPLS